MNLVELDYAAGSIGVDLEGDYPVSRIVMIPLAPTNRVTPEAIRVFTSTTNYANEWAEVTEAEKRYVTQAGVKKLEITFPEGTTARFIKVKTNYDERKKDFTLLNKAEFKNAPESLIRVYYSVTKREEVYQYDKLGNRTRLEVRMKGSEVREYRYYPNSSLLMTDGKWAYSYDKNGKLVKKGDTLSISGTPTLVKDIASTYWAGITNPWTGLTFAETGTQLRYSYDLRNRMIEAKKNGATTATYTYTAMGLKVKKERTATTDKAAATIYYAYTLGGRLLYEEEKEATAATSTYYENVYAYGKNFALEEGTLDAAGQPTATGRTYLHTDHLGSVVAATDSTGVTVWTNEYTPFGTSADEAKRKDKYARFTGKQYDEEAGLYYFNMRWYDPETGRFTSEDPVKDGKAWYAYAANNPLRFIDQTGFWRSDIHDRSEEYGGTYGWSIAKGFSPEDADRRAKACQEVDDNPLTSPYPRGNPSLHFDTDKSPYRDSRTEAAMRSLEQAIEMENNAKLERDSLLEQGVPQEIANSVYGGMHQEAVATLGKGDHPAQDTFAHTEDSKSLLDSILGFFGFESHFGSNMIGRDPDDPRDHKDAVAQTKEATDKRSEAFLSLTTKEARDYQDSLKSLERSSVFNDPSLSELGLGLDTNATSYPDSYDGYGPSSGTDSTSGPEGDGWGGS